MARAVVGLLVAANLAAGVMVFKPWGGSPQELKREFADLQQQIRQRRVSLERLRVD